MLLHRQGAPATRSDRDGSAADPGPPRRRAGLAAFAAGNAIAAWGGAVGLLVGALDFGEATNARLPFDSLALAGVALAVIVAVPLTAVAGAAWTRSTRTNAVALLTGVMLVGWILLQIALLRTFSFFQPLYLVVGAAFIAWSRRAAVDDRPGVTVGVGSRPEA